MRWNGKFRYSKAVSKPTYDSDGYPVPYTVTDWIDGTLCYIERNAPAKHQVAVDGQRFVYTYTMYTSAEFAGKFDAGDTIEVTLEDGSVITKLVLGTDSTDRKALAVWL